MSFSKTVFHVKDAAHLWAALDDIGVGFRYNERVQEYQVLLPDDDDFNELFKNKDLLKGTFIDLDYRDGQVRARLVHVLNDRYNWKNNPSSTDASEWRDSGPHADLGKVLKNIAYDKGYDAGKEFIKTIPEWDGERRLSKMLQHTLDAPNDYLSMWAGCAMFMQAYSRLVEPGIRFRTYVGLVGPENNGKSSLMGAMWPKEFDLHLEGETLTSNTNEIMRKATAKGCATVEIADEIFGSKALGAVKRILTVIETVFDKKFRNAERVLMFFTVFFAFNEGDSHLPRSKDHTRFLLIGCDRPGDSPEYPAIAHDWVTENRMQLWAEAKHWYEKYDLHDNFSYCPGHLPKELRVLQKNSVKRYVYKDEDMEDSLVTVINSGDIKEDKWYGRKYIQEMVIGKDASQKEKTELGRLLPTYGFEEAYKRLAKGARPVRCHLLPGGMAKTTLSDRLRDMFGMDGLDDMEEDVFDVIEPPDGGDDAPPTRDSIFPAGGRKRT